MKTIRYLLVFILILISETFYVSDTLYALSWNENILIAKNTNKEKSSKNKINKNNNKNNKQYLKKKKSKSAKYTIIDHIRELIDQRKLTKAFSMLSSLLKNNPSKEAYFQMGRIYAINGNYKTAHMYFKKASRYIDPQSAYDYAFMYYNLKNYYQAARGFSEVSKDSYLKNISNFYAGICYLELNRISDAEKYFRRAKNLPPRYEDLKQRYLNAIQADDQSSTTYTLSSRMSLPPVNDINTQAVITDEKGEKHPVESIESSGFKFPASFKIAGGIGGSGSRNTYVDFVETTEFEIKPTVELDGRFEPNYSRTLRNKRDLKISLPLNLNIKYGDAKPIPGTAGDGSAPTMFLTGSSSENAKKEKSFADDINTKFSFKPNIGVPIFKATTLGAKHELSLALKGTDTSSLKFTNFLAAYYETRWSSTNLSLEFGGTYDLSGLPSAGSNSSDQEKPAEAVMGVKGAVKLNGGADIISYKASIDLKYNMQTDQNLSDSVTNDMEINYKGGVGFNGKVLGLDLDGKYTQKKDNKEATVEGSKEEGSVSAMFKSNWSLVGLGLKGTYTVYPEYVYKNDTGYVTTEGNSTSLMFVFKFTPLSWMSFSTNLEYYTNDYGIDDGYSATFYSKEKKHVLSSIRYGIQANLSYTF